MTQLSDLLPYRGCCPIRLLALRASPNCPERSRSDHNCRIACAPSPFETLIPTMPVQAIREVSALIPTPSMSAALSCRAWGQLAPRERQRLRDRDGRRNTAANRRQRPVSWTCEVSHSAMPTSRPLPHAVYRRNPRLQYASIELGHLEENEAPGKFHRYERGRGRLEGSGSDLTAYTIICLPIPDGQRFEQQKHSPGGVRVGIVFAADFMNDIVAAGHTTEDTRSGSENLRSFIFVAIVCLWSACSG